LRGCLTIRASNVTVRRSRIRATCGVGTGDHTAYSNILIEDVELDGGNAAQNAGVAGDGITVRRADIHGYGTLVRSGNNFTVEDSWLHDNATGTTAGAAMSARYGHHLVVRHNRLSCTAGRGCSAALALYAKDSGTEGMGDILIQNNIFRTDDGPCLFAGHDLNAGTSAGLARDERVLDNAFTPGDCGAGYVYHWGTTDLNGASLDNTWSGNYLYPDR